MGIVQATPKPGSYCTEWTALRYDAAEGIAAAKKLLRGSPWAIYLALEDASDPYIVASTGHEINVVHHGEWIVKSPHGKFWFMPHDEFLTQFDYEPEA